MVGNVALKLHLLRKCTRVHNVPHVNLVMPYLHRSGDQPSRQRTKPPAPIQFLDGELLFEVEALLDHEVVTFTRGRGKIRNLKAFYRLLVKFANYSEDNKKWNSEEGLPTCDDTTRDYNAENGLAEKATETVNI